MLARCTEHTHSPEEDVVNLPSDVGPQAEKLSVDAMENCLEEVSLSRVLAVKQLKHAQHKRLVNVSLREGGLEFWRLKEAQKECVYQLQGGGGGGVQP